MIGNRRTSSHSSVVSGSGLRRMASGTAAFPMSWSVASRRMSSRDGSRTPSAAAIRSTRSVTRCVCPSDSPARMSSVRTQVARSRSRKAAGRAGSAKDGLHQTNNRARLRRLGGGRVQRRTRGPVLGPSPGVSRRVEDDLRAYDRGTPPGAQTRIRPSGASERPRLPTPGAGHELRPVLQHRPQPRTVRGRSNRAVSRGTVSSAECRNDQDLRLVPSPSGCWCADSHRLQLDSR